MSEEVARRMDAINTKGRSLTLKIMKRDPSAPVEAPKVCHTRRHAVQALSLLGVVYGTRAVRDVQ